MFVLICVIYLIILDSAKGLGTLCGSKVNERIFSTDQCILVRMFTDDRITTVGFSATYISRKYYVIQH